MEEEQLKLQVSLHLNKNVSMEKKAEDICTHALKKYIDSHTAKQLVKKILMKMHNGGIPDFQAQAITDMIMKDYVTVKKFCEEEDEAAIKPEIHRTLLCFRMDVNDISRVFILSEERYRRESSEYEGDKLFLFEILKLPDPLKNIWKSTLNFPLDYLFNVAQNYFEIYKSVDQK